MTDNPWNGRMDDRFESEAGLPSPAKDSDIQEALSRRYSDSVAVVLRLRSGRYAIYNNLRELCGIADSLEEWPPAVWRAPTPPKKPAAVMTLPRKPSKPVIDLKELDLL